jgi:hypothetical protein
MAGEDSSLCVSVPSYEIRKDDAGKEFCAYQISCTESDASWVINRRWNDLKLMHNELSRTHGETLYDKRANIPKFEAHAWRLGSSMLDADFLKQRCAAAQELLQALVREFGVSVESETGPEPLRQLLQRGGQPGRRSSLEDVGLSGAALEPASTKAEEEEEVKAGALRDATGPTAIDEPEKAEAAEPPTPETQTEKKKDTNGSAAVKQLEANEEQTAPGDDGRPPVSLATVVMWTSVVLLPVGAIVAKEAFGVNV